MTELQIRRLIKELSSPNASKRRLAAVKLADADERAIYPLIKALNDENLGVQDAAISSLISIGGEVVAYMVSPLLRCDAHLRNISFMILKELRSETLSLIPSLLRDKDQDIRKFAIDLICEIGYFEYPELIASMLENDNDINVRMAAVKAIGILRYHQAIPQLINALRDDEWLIFSSLEALGELKDNECIEHVVELLSSKLDSVRYAAIETLEKIGTEESVKALLSLWKIADGLDKRYLAKSLSRLGLTIDSEDFFNELLNLLKTGDNEEKIIAIKSLSKFNKADSMSVIIDFAGSLDPSNPDEESLICEIKEFLMNSIDKDIILKTLVNPSLRFRGRVFLINIISENKLKEAIPLLESLLDADERDVRRAAINAIAGIDPLNSKGIFLKAINDYDSHVRKTAISALGEMEESSAFEPIMSLLEKEDYQDVCEAAVLALYRIDSERFLSSAVFCRKDIKDLIDYLRIGAA